MNLILELVVRDGQVPDGERRKVFGVTGGRIGRASDCDWVLHSPYVSRYHATVCYIEGTFHIVSTSDNGVALNDAFTTLPQLENQALRHGDHLFIDEYEIAVSIGDATPEALPSAPEVAPEPASFEDELTRESPLLQSAFGLDPLREFTPHPAPSTNTPPEEVAWNHSPGLADHFVPPPVNPVPAALPADWDQTHLPAPAPAAPVPTPPALEASGNFDLSLFLRGAGLDPDSLPPQMAFTLGRMLRTSVQGLIEALRTRAEFRDQFRLPVTRVKMSENNPLKFAVDVDDAWSSLLRKPADRYLGALEAVDDAFDNIRTHHLAMIVGMQAGFQSVLNRFDPKNLTQEFDKRSRRGGLGLAPAGLRYWRQYVDLFEYLTIGDAQGTFRRLFGEEFAQAYERHLDTAKHQPGKL
jgi:type VI secretion system protein ImpI